MGSPTDEPQPQASTSQQGSSNGAPAGPPAAGQAGPRKAMKEMTKAERRAIQEAQRAAKAKEREEKQPAKKGGQEGAKKKDAPAAGSSRNAEGGSGSRKQQTGQNSQQTAQTTSTNDSTLPGHHYAQTSAAGATASPLSMFLHLDPPKSAKSLNAKIHKEQIHPSILRLALQYADFRIVGANARCIAMLEAFKEVISSYIVPPGKSLTRHLPSHLSPQITHLVQARPMAISMGNAIRYLKWEISHIPPDMQDDDARELLCERIDHFIRDRIVLAGKVVEDLALSKIKDDDVILTFGRSSLVEGVLLAAKEHGKRFSVIIVDSRPMHEGKNLLRALLAADVPCTYVLLSSIGSVLSNVSLTLLGAAAMLSNGAMFSRAGSATVAMMSKGAGVPVVCCCETYKFSDRIMLDSIVGNELASTAGLLPSSVEADKNQNLGVLNFLYDVTRPEDITAVITETAIVPVLSVPFVLREHKPINLGE
ncbi:nagb/rpia/CoA transferase-like protein [Cystobasidium minutum MCA 4210]|uniref:nagb/rpia/CoA transferase-like protein n=1 Tax=Cystobasidium minutum MCA 4210 TaxID=1397322 RepID=UPI0034CF8FA1|eukprot:jgi/Rhomi1/185079/estExt_fgenesh1_pm.C_20070